jgi:puromycin-sensitive aminopeptidase
VDYIGEDTFRQGLNLYLTRHQYRNATTADLWQALSEKSGTCSGGRRHMAPRG